MKIKMLSKQVMVVAGILLAASSASANEGSLAEEIWSENFCEQAVSLAKQRGEAPEALNLVSCRLLNYYQPSYWQCVIAAMKSNSSMKLDTARQKCLAEY
ncbi:MAG: hypothetical protein JNK95_02270 [Candidatus Competibacter sp.]|nr:hypothetical protein [Candidatus Competibacter sp.]MDG4606152.1 hypothetical protein [Candidatus Contendobacter sp.]HRD50532.1 hypothetical protein [Candidatus Contendobacter sp.]